MAQSIRPISLSYLSFVVALLPKFENPVFAPATLGSGYNFRYARATGFSNCCGILLHGVPVGCVPKFAPGVKFGARGFPEASHMNGLRTMLLPLVVPVY